MKQQYNRLPLFSAALVVLGLQGTPLAAARVNLPPSISGFPATTIAAGSEYGFTPTATESVFQETHLYAIFMMSI